jgi:PAS domain S-box-containing protein
MVWEIDAVGGTMVWSAHAARLIGFETPSAGVPLARFYDAVHPDDRRRLERGIARGMKRGRMRIAFRFVRPDGAICRVVARGIVIGDGAEHDAMRMIGRFDSRSAARHDDRSAIANHHRIALAATAADVGFWRLDLVTHRRWISPFTAALFGLGPHEKLTTDMFYAAVHPEDRDRVRASRDRVSGDRSQFDEMFRIIRPDGATRWVHSVGVLLRDARTGHDHLVGVLADVTARVLEQQELQEQRRQLEHLARVAAVGELSGAVTHELSQPIAAIVTNAQAAREVLERDGTIDRAVLQEVLTDISDAGKRAGSVMQHIRGLIRNEPPAAEAVHVGDLVTEVLAIMRSELLAHGVAAQADVAPSLPHVRGDRVQLQQILVNLILNACDAMALSAPADRRLAISASAFERGCTLVIADHGPGISVVPTDRIFEPFVTTKANGAGLGLAISRKAVVAHGGRLWAENNPGGGAAFHLELPYAVESSGLSTRNW